MGVYYYRGAAGPNDRRNVADSFYYLTDDIGRVKMIPTYVTPDPVRGSDSDGHSENVIMNTFKRQVDWFVNWLKGNRQRECDYSGWTMHLTLFTEVAPCSRAGFNCDGVIRTLTNQMRAELNKVGVGLSVSVWWRKPIKGQTPLRQVISGFNGLQGRNY